MNCTWLKDIYEKYITRLSVLISTNVSVPENASSREILNDVTDFHIQNKSSNKMQSVNV